LDSFAICTENSFEKVALEKAVTGKIYYQIAKIGANSAYMIKIIYQFPEKFVLKEDLSLSLASKD